MELNIIDEQIDNDMDEIFAHYEKTEIEREILLKNSGQTKKNLQI